jgi:hypothetical protein
LGRCSEAIKYGTEVCACAATDEELKNEGITSDMVKPGVKLENITGFPGRGPARREERLRCDLHPIETRSEIQAVEAPPNVLDTRGLLCPCPCIQVR